MLKRKAKRPAAWKLFLVLPVLAMLLTATFQVTTNSAYGQGVSVFGATSGNDPVDDDGPRCGQDEDVFPVDDAPQVKPVSSPTPAPTAVVHTSDVEIKKTLVRALDKVEAQEETIKAKNAEIKAKDEVIAAQERSQADTDAAKEKYKKTADTLKEALTAEQKVSLSERDARLAEERRVKDLEKKLRKSNSRLKAAVFGVVVGSIIGLLLGTR